MWVISLREQFLDMAYNHPKAAESMFRHAPTICPKCMSELAHVLDNHWMRRILLCGNCGLVFKEKEAA